MFVYLIYLAVFFALPVLALGLLLRRTILRFRRTVLWALLFVYTLGMFWDWLCYKTGVWRYDSAETVGIWLDGLPIEEFVGFYVLGVLLIVGVALFVLEKSDHV